MKKVRKAVIPAAGLGTRFFPATKNIPKEMLPLVDKPTILYVVEEAMRAGIEDIILIAGRGKHSIEDFFDISYEVEDKLVKEGKENLIQSLNQIRQNVNIISIRQKSALGLGHAIKCAEHVVGEEPFAVLLGDEITITEGSQKNVTSFLADRYYESKASSVWVLPVETKDTSKYGIVNLGPSRGTDLAKQAKGERVLNVIEKPAPEVAPSTWALPGRYIFTSEIFQKLADISPGKNGEFQLSDAMNLLAQSSELRAYNFQARRYDAGDKVGFLMANIELALDRPDLRTELLAQLKKLLSTV